MEEYNLYEEYCNEYPLMSGYREVSYQDWLEKEVTDLRNIINNYSKQKNIKKCNQCNGVDFETMNSQFTDCDGDYMNCTIEYCTHCKNTISIEY